MEDQRNWSDASFKTYGRPLELPWPFVLPAGVPIAQSVAVVRAAGRRRRAGQRPPADAAGRGRDRRADRRALPRDRAGGHGGRGAGGPRRPRPAEGDRAAALLCAYDPTAGDGPDALAAFARLQAAFPARL